MNRRDFLRVSSGGAAVSAAAGVAVGPGTAAAQEGQTHTVDMTDSFVFDPDELTIAPGDTVTWENVGALDHSVTAYEADIPGDATYFASGDYESEQAARDAYPGGGGHIAGGETYSHTFEVEGTYEYFCIPHESAQMVGTITVQEGGGGDGGGEDAYVSPVTDTFKTLGVATGAGIVAVLVMAYTFLKYGGLEAGPSEE